MRKFLATAAVLGATAIFAAPAGATTTDSCLDRTAPRRCVAQTAETHVTSAVITMGRYSHGGYFLTCTKAGKTSLVSGLVGVGRTRVLQIVGPGNISCSLRVVARASTRWAFGRATLLTG